MALETFNYLNSLVATNPVVNDGLVNGDDHIRGIKLTLLNTFPNITGAVTASHTALNSVAGWSTSGVNLLAHAGAFFDNGSGAASTDGLQNTLAGDIDVVLQGTVAATFQRTVGVNSLKVFGGIQATGEIKGPGICPPGSTVLWFDNTLPSDGLWVWANGQVIANANVVAPTLLSRWGSRYGGNGTTSMGVPDLRETVPVANSTMGSTTARGLITNYTSATLTAIGGWFGEALHQLLIGEIPNHRHGVVLTDPGHAHGGGFSSQSPAFLAAGGNSVPSTVNQGLVTTASTGITISDGAGTANVTTSVGSGTAHNNIQPSTVVNWIIRIG